MNVRARLSSRPSSAPSVPRSGEYAAVRYTPYTGPCEVPAAVESVLDAEWPFAELDVASTASAARVCDAVHVKGEAGEGVVYLIDGRVVWVRMEASTRERAGVLTFRERIVADGCVSRSELELVDALARADGGDVCERLISLGLIEVEALQAAFKESMRAQLRSLLSLSEREASWTRATVSVAAGLSVSIDQVLEPADVRRWRRLVVDAGGSPASRHDEARIPLRRTAQVDTVNGTVMMTTLDISEAGMRLRASTLVPVASRVLVRLSIAGAPLELSGRVVRFDRPDPGGPPVIVVLWTELPDATEQAFARILDTIY